MPAEKQPNSPVYMAYIYEHPEPMSRPPAVDVRMHSTSGSPYRPSTQLTQAELDLQATKGVYDHFHTPWNQHNKFLSSVREADKYAYRDIQRMSPPPFDKSGRSSIRPQSAPRPRTALPGGTHSAHSARIDTTGATLLDNMVTQTGAPCYTVSALVAADVADGQPLLYPEAEEDWKVARVQTYAVPPARMGYAEGGTRPFHQDYRHYKYYGFAGKGAKTSWAFNPKYNQIYAQIITEAADSTSPNAVTDLSMHEGEPLQQTIGGPRRPLTRAEAQLVQQFRMHAYSMEGKQSKLSRAEAAANSPPGHRSTHEQRRPHTAPPKHVLPHAEIVEPYMEHVSIVTRQPLTPQEVRDRQRTDRAKVATYRQPSPSVLTLAENPSPNHGSQSPFHQRYNHYRYNGFSGKGATSSWARNPKYALLYDN